MNSSASCSGIGPKKKKAKSTHQASQRQARASQRQMDLLVDILSCNPHLSSGKFQTAHGNQQNVTSWENVASELNQLFGNGKTKDVESWKNTWRDLKSQVSVKAIELKKCRAQTGNNPLPFKLKNGLSERDQKILNIVGVDYVEGMAGTPDAFPDDQVNISNGLRKALRSKLPFSDVRPCMIDGQIGAMEQLVEGNAAVLYVEPASLNLAANDDENIVIDINDVPLQENAGTSMSEKEREEAVDDVDMVCGASTENGDNVETGSVEAAPTTSSSASTPHAHTARVRKESTGASTNSAIKGTGSCVNKGVQRMRLGSQLQEARVHFGSLQERQVQCMEALAEATAMHAKAAVLMAENDTSRNAILKVIAENDKARNEVLTRLVRLLEHNAGL